MTETTITQEKIVVVNSKDELLNSDEFKKILELYGTFSNAFNEALLGEDFYIDRNFWPTLSNDECEELFEIIPLENFHAKKILFRILINRGEITKSNVSSYVNRFDLSTTRKRFHELFNDYAVYIPVGDSL